VRLPSRPTVDSQAPARRADSYEGGSDPRSKRNSIGVARCRNDAAVVKTLAVQLLEMAAVMGEDRSTQRVGAGQDIDIGSRAKAVLLGGQDIVSE
jgi:hypothetical protein